VLAGHLSAEEARQLGIALDAGLAAHATGEEPRDKVASGKPERDRSKD
jgi:hypothetical protein